MSNAYVTDDGARRMDELFEDEMDESFIMEMMEEEEDEEPQKEE